MTRFLFLILALLTLLSSALAQENEQVDQMERDLWRPDYGNEAWKKPEVEKIEPPKVEKKEKEPPPEIPPIPGTFNFSQDQYKAPIEKKPDYRHPFIKELRDVPEKDHEWSELEIARGLFLLNEEKFEEAEKHFLKAIAQDPRNFLGHEQLSWLRERKGDLSSALTWIVRAKHLAPQSRAGILNFQIGRIYVLMDNEARARIYLNLALEQAGHPAQTHYLLGYLDYRHKKYGDALIHFKASQDFIFHKYSETKDPRLGQNADKKNIDPLDRNSSRELLQAIDFYLGDIYSKTGYPRYAAASFQLSEYGSSTEIRTKAWEIHGKVNKPIPHFSVGEYVQYDSNIILLARDSNAPELITRMDSFKNIVLGRVGLQSSPTPRLSGGLDTDFLWNYHFENDFHEYDVLNGGGDAWVNYWNRKYWSLWLRYSGDHAWVNRNAFSRYQLFHGPTLSGAFFPFHRWTFEGGFQYRTNVFYKDPIAGVERRSGYSYISFLKTFLRSPEARLEPSFEYRFEANAANGENFKAYIHSLNANLGLKLTRSTKLIGGAEISRLLFPRHLVGRSDWLLEGKGSLQQDLGNHFMFSIEAIDMFSYSTLKEFTFNRYALTSGLSYTL